jgi:hypothetical protein
MNTQLEHIFDDSTCLTRRQLRDYANGTMSAEECHAAEHHINSCPFCSEAIEGMAIHEAEAIGAVNELNTRFLKEHFDSHMLQVHLNSLAPVASANSYDYKGTKKHGHKNGIVITGSSVAAAVLLILGVMGYLRFEKHPAPAIMPQSNTNVVNNTPTTTTNNNNTKPIASFAKETSTPSVATTNKPIVKTTAIKNVTAVTAEKKRSIPFVADDNVKAGNDLYKSGGYSAALAYYQKEMDNGTNRRQRHQATIMAAHCYEQMGQKDKAAALLQNLVNEGGPKKGHAKRMLQQIDNAQE